MQGYQKKYKALSPIYKPAGYSFDGEEQFVVRWKVLGFADTMQEAKKITQAPVLEEVK